MLNRHRLTTLNQQTHHFRLQLNRLNRRTPRTILESPGEHLAELRQLNRDRDPGPLPLLKLEPADIRRTSGRFKSSDAVTCARTSEYPARFAALVPW